jgi:hypothetical protein
MRTGADVEAMLLHGGGKLLNPYNVASNGEVGVLDERHQRTGFDGDARAAGPDMMGTPAR